MRVVHLVTATSGGAAQAAIRLHESLTEAGCDSKVISVQRRTRLVSSGGIKFQDIGRLSSLRSSSITFLQGSLIQAGDDLVSPISLDLLDWNDPDIEEADVLHLHAFYNLVSVKSFLKMYPCKKKVITLHDERFYTGGCHYSHECLKFISGCHTCPQVKPLFHSLVEKQKRDVKSLIGNNSRVVLVCPSTWILNRALKSFPETQEKSFVQIFNPIPSLDKSLTSNKSNDSRINFGFISQNLDNPIKNLQLLLKSFKQINQKNPRGYSLTLVGASEKNYSVNYENTTQTIVRNPGELQLLLSEMDVLVVPSSHDNSPNVLGEALMNGVGLIGSDAGGIPEIIHLFSQSLFQNGDQDGLIHAMQNYRLTDRLKLQRRAEEVFGYKAIAEKMIAVYSSWAL